MKTVFIFVLLFSVNLMADQFDDFVGNYQTKVGEKITASIKKVLIGDTHQAKYQIYLYTEFAGLLLDEENLSVGDKSESLYLSTSTECETPCWYVSQLDVEALFSAEDQKSYIIVNYYGDITDEGDEPRGEFSKENIILYKVEP